MNDSYNKELLKYALGILILLAFIAILGIYVFFLGRVGGTQYGAGVLLSNSSDDINARLAGVQKEIDDTLARVRAIEGSDVSSRETIQPQVRPSATSATSHAFLRISKFMASQNSVASGNNVTFNYGAENTSNGVSFRLLLQCPSGVTAIYQNGSNVCRRGLNEALPIDNSGSYTVSFANNSYDPQIVIAVLLASDITENNIFFRDSKVLTVSILPSGNYNPITDANAPVVLSVSPSGGTAPATIGFTATLNNLKTCMPANWSFGDGMSSGSFSVCPNSNGNIKVQVLTESHTYNQPGTYTATFTFGGRTVSSTIYVSGATTMFNTQPIYTPTYSYVPQQPATIYYTTPAPVYNYVQPAVYPSLPDIPTVPGNLRAVTMGAGGVTLSWSAPVFGNVYNYIIYRKGGDSLPLPVNATSPCSGNSVNSCYYSVSGNATSFTDLGATAGGTYTYRIVASNGYGTSNPSEALTVVLSASNSPSTPRTFTASADHGVINLNWSTPSSGAPVSYTIYRRIGSTLNIPVLNSPQSCASSSTETCYYFVSGQTTMLSDVNVSPNSTYTYRIVATNLFGASDYSDSLTVNSGQPLPPVNTPTMNQANRRDEVMTTLLSWNSVGATYYRVFRSASRNTPVGANESLISGCSQATTNGCFLNFGNDYRIFSLQATDNQYDNTKTYYYQVRAYGMNGASDWSNEVSTVPTTVPTPAPLPPPVVVPPPPTLPPTSVPTRAITIDATRISVQSGQTTINLSWNRPDSITTGYDVYRTTDPNAAWINSTPHAVSLGSNVSGRVDDNGLVPNTTYYYYIFSTVSGREGALNSSPAKISVTTLPSSSAQASSPEPVISSFLVAGQTAPTVNTDVQFGLTYGGSNVTSYKLLLQCPANVSALDASGNELCRSGENNAVLVSPSGSIQIAIFNMTANNQTINATLYALRANGTVAHSITRTITVRPHPAF